MSMVLAYNLLPERAGRIRTLCAIEKLRLRLVDSSEFGLPVGVLAGVLPPLEAAAVEPFSEEMLVLCGLSEAALQRFLTGFRKHSIPPVALKAVLTPTNAVWNAKTLRDELKKEHAAMTGRG